jgi:hypothetical protein
MRLAHDGTVDTAFGGDAGVTFASSPGGETTGSAILTAQGLVVCSTQSVGSTPGDLVLRRTGSNGVLDPTFGDAGSLVITGEQGRSFECAALAGAGARLIVAGTTRDRSTTVPNARVTLAGVRQDGTLDPSFGVAGVAVQAGLGEATAMSMAVPQSLEWIYTGTITDAGASLVRDLPDGGTDDTFGTGGSLPSGTNAIRTAPVVTRALPDGRVVMAGALELSGVSTWFVARYLP